MNNAFEKCGVTTVTKITTKWPIAGSSLWSSVKGNLILMLKLFLEKSFFKEINVLKKQLKPAKKSNYKKIKTESFLSKEVNQTHSCQEDEKYFVVSTINFSTNDKEMKIIQ
jgi:hypothetical protein